MAALSGSQPKVLVFGYGSNGVAQLRARCSNPTLTLRPARLPDHARVFCLRSPRWGQGGVASLAPAPHQHCLGSVAELSVKEKELLERAHRDADERSRREAEERVARAKAKASAEAGEEERLRSTREHVIEKILNVSCTRCGQAFCDFSGCFALKCSRCNAGICAYCTADVGVDAHRHIAHCPAAKEVLAWQAKGKDGKSKVKKR